MQRAALGVLLLLLIAPLARAQSPEQAYIAERSAASAKVEAVKGDALDKAQAEAQRALEPKLRALIGPVVPPPSFSGAGEFRPAALCCFIEAGALDGLSFRNEQGGQVVVSTEGLLRLWHGADAKAALENDSFRYTNGLGADAAVTPVVPLPIRPPAGASLAVARLAMQCNGFCALPDKVTVVVVARGRAWVAMVPAAISTGGSPAGCDAVWQAAIGKHRKAYSAFDAARSRPGASDLLTAANKLETEGGAAVQKCLKDNGASAFPELTRQAQALANSLATP